MPLIIRAIITGFGYKVGAELGRYFAERIGLKQPDNTKEELPEGIATKFEDDVDEDPGADALN